MEVRGLRQREQIQIVTRLQKLDGLISLYLVGSAAGAELVADMGRLVSDIELVAVVDSVLLRRRKIRMLAELLTNDLGTDVEIMVLTRNRIERLAPKAFVFRENHMTIVMHDIIARAKLIWGDAILEAKRPVAFPKIYDALLLIINRFVEASPYVEKNSQALTQRLSDPPEAKFWLFKLYVGLGDALLINDNIYSGSYGARRELFLNAPSRGILDQKLVERIDSAYNSRIGLEFDVIEVSRCQILSDLREVIGRLYLKNHANYKHDGLVNHQYIETLFRGKYRYLAPFKSADVLCEFLISISLGGIKLLRYKSVREAFVKNTPIRNIFYREVVICIMNSDTESFDDLLRARLGKYFSLTENKVLGEQVQRIWKVYAC